MASGETELQFRVEVGGINQFGKLNSQVVMLNKGLIRVKQSNQNLVSVFKKQKGVAGTVNKIFYGQAQTLKQLVRNQKIFRREITHITGKMKVARRETKLGSKAWRHYSRMIRQTKRQMRTLPLRKLGTDLRNLTTRMVKMGKNLQWVGRQMMVGITAPLGMLLRIGMRAFESFEKQLVRTQKILALTNEEMEPIRENIMGISTRMGVARSIVAGLTSDFAQMGRNLLGGNEALTETASRYAELTLQLELVGQVSANVGRDFIANLAGIVKHSTNVGNRLEIVAGLLAKFNMLENTTALSLKDLAEAFPQVSPAAKAAGVDLLFLAGVIGNMKEVGLNATESAHALKFGLQRLINPTRKVRDMAEDFADAIGPQFHEDLGFGNMLLFNLAENMGLIEQKAGSKAAISYLGELVGKRQASRLYAATMNMVGFADSVDQMHDAFRRATEIDPSQMFENYEPTGVSVGPQIDALAAVSNIDELRDAIRNIFQDDEHVQAFKDAVIATDMAIAAGVNTMKTHSEGLNENSATSRVLTVAFQELEPALKGLAIDFMGATVAGKVFEEEMDVVLKGPAATLARLKNDMKNMLQEFAASFYTALKPAIAAIRQFILKIRDMPPHMKQGIVVMLGMLAVVGPLAFGIAMMMVSFGVIGTVLVRIIPKMKTFSQSLMVSKHLAGENADRLLPFGAGLAVVGKQAGNTAKNILGLTSAVHAQAAALQGDMSVALSSFGAFSALVTAEVAGATGTMLTTLGAAYKGLTAFTTKAIVKMGMVAAIAEAATLATAATTVAEAAVLMGGAEAALGTALHAQVAEFTTATAKMSTITAKTSRRAKRIILKDINVIRLAMLDSMAQLGAAGATTVATTAGIAHSATATTTAAQAKMFSTTRGLFAANNAMLKTFSARATARLAKMIGLQKISAALAARKLPARVPAGQPGAGQFAARLTGTARLTAFTSKVWKATQAKISFGWIKVAKTRITSGVAAARAVKMANIKAALTTTAGWKAGGLRSAKGLLLPFKIAFKAIRLNAAMSATFMKLVFTKASKAIRLAMMGTGIMMILIAVAGAIVFIVAHFDKFKAAAGGALGAFKQAWTNLKGAFMEVGTAIFEVFGQIFGGEAQAGADGMTQTFSGVQVAIQFIADALVLLSRIFLTYVRGVIIPIIQTLGKIFGWLADKIKEKVDFIKARWGEIGPKVGSVVRVILFLFGLLVKQVAIQVRILATILGRLAEGVFWLLEEVFAPVIGAIVSLFSQLLGVVTEVVRYILIKFLDFLGWISPVMNKLLGGFNDIIGFLNWALGSDMGKIEFDFGSDIEQLKEDIDNGFGAVDEGRKDVEKFINEAVPAIVGVAGDVVGGIINGVNAAATEVDENIMRLVGEWGDNLDGALSGEEGASLLAENLTNAAEDFTNRPWVNPEDAGPMSVHDSIELAAYEGLQDALNTFVDRVKTALSSAVSDQVKAGMAAFEAKADIFLQGFETQIDAIEEVKKAEKELTATIKYETDRRAQINKMALDRENFVRNRSLAIYEGRIEDARNLSVQFKTNQEKANDRLTQLDDKRAEKILSQQRAAAIAEISQAQEDAKNRLDILKLALENDLNLLAENLPKDEAEWAEMLTGMDTAVTAKMVEAFGPEGAAATSLDGFAGIVDEKLGDTFSTLLANVGVDTTGITSVAGTLRTAFTDWETIIAEKDLGGMFTGIFDKVNELWKEELNWEIEAHESMTNHFDDQISDLTAHLKWLKGELDDLTGDWDTDTTPAREADRREAHRKAREGGLGHDSPLNPLFGAGSGWGSSQHFYTPSAPISGGITTSSQMNARWGASAMQQYAAQSTSATAAAAAEQATNIGNAVGIVLTPALTDIVAAVTAANNINLTIDTTDIPGRGLDEDLGSPKGSGAGTGGGGGSGTPWDTSAWYYTPNFSDDSFTEKAINQTINAAGFAATWAAEEVVTTVTDPIWAVAGFLGDLVNGPSSPSAHQTEVWEGAVDQYNADVDMMSAYNQWAESEGWHKGGLIKGLKGEVKNVKAHAGEYILNAQAVNDFGLENVDAVNSGSGGAMARSMGEKAASKGMLATGGGGDVTNIYIDTMVGDPAFAESQAKIFKEHVQAKHDRNAGKEIRSISSMSEL